MKLKHLAGNLVCYAFIGAWWAACGIAAAIIVTALSGCYATLPGCATTQAGCAARAPTAVSLATPAPKLPGVFSAATLALAGTCETDVAADYTALITTRWRATSALHERRITVAQAQAVQAHADAARAELDAACTPGKPVLPDRVIAARKAIAAAQQVLESKP